METTAFRTLVFTLFFSFLFLFQPVKADDFYNREDIKARLEAMELIVQPRYTNSVESYIRGYLAKDGAKAERILARTVVYFPIFEKYLDEHNMPEDLKYLAVVESGLNPKAVSRVGATGLWQFMKETGSKEYGLRINSRIDERSCPHSSTIAAMKYLARAYERFGSWELALASYNCGAGNVNRAIRRAGGVKDYWSISKYLPRETRNFVPAFLGAAYIAKYHHTHGVLPQYPDLDMQLTEGVKVYTELDFQTIARVSGLPVEVVEKLNPHYKRGYVPAYSKGHFVILPSRVMQSLKDYLHLLRPDNGSASEMPEIPELVGVEDYFPDDYYYETFYTVAQGDQLNDLGKIFKCSGFSLKVWNELTSKHISRGQELVVWFPKELRRFRTGSDRVDVLPVVSQPTAPAMEVKRYTPKIQPIEPVEMAPFPMPQQEVPYATAARNLDELETGSSKLSPFQKAKIWTGEKGRSIFKKKKR